LLILYCSTTAEWVVGGGVSVGQALFPAGSHYPEFLSQQALGPGFPHTRTGWIIDRRPLPPLPPPLALLHSYPQGAFCLHQRTADLDKQLLLAGKCSVRTHALTLKGKWHEICTSFLEGESAPTEPLFSKLKTTFNQSINQLWRACNLT
jgi:hypothetical protein